MKLIFCLVVLWISGLSVVLGHTNIPPNTYNGGLTRFERTGHTNTISPPSEGCLTSFQRKDFATNMLRFYKELEKSIPDLTSEETKKINQEQKKLLDSKVNGATPEGQVIRQRFLYSKPNVLLGSKRVAGQIIKRLEKILEAPDEKSEVLNYLELSSYLIYLSDGSFFDKLMKLDGEVDIPQHLWLDGAPSRNTLKDLALVINSKVIVPYINGEAKRSKASG